MTAKKQAEKIPELTGSQKRTLRGFGHELKPVILVGKEGLNGNLIAGTKAALAAHELIKVKLGQNAPLSREEAAETLSQLTRAALVQQIGGVILLYRPNRDLPQDKRIRLS